MSRLYEEFSEDFTIVVVCCAWVAVMMWILLAMSLPTPGTLSLLCNNYTPQQAINYVNYGELPNNFVQGCQKRWDWEALQTMEK